MKKLLLSGLATAVFAISGSAMAANFVAGQDYIFVRTPAAMNPVWEQAARAYYVSEALGVRKKTHLTLFHAIHDQNQPILEQPALAKFYTQFGIPEAKFNSTYKSFAITSKIAQAQDLAKRYQLSGVPAVTVNGKYIVQGEDAKVTQVVDYLIEKERAAKKAESVLSPY